MKRIPALSIGLMAAMLVQPARAATVIADSVSEYSAVQGQDNWYYGYIEPDIGPEFRMMTDYNTQLEWWRVDPTRFWTTLYWIGGHPNGRRSGIEQWAVRRWVSEVVGTITISGNLAKQTLTQGGYGGNGVVGEIYADGNLIWSQWVGGTDTIGVDYQVTLNVARDMPVDFVLKAYEREATSDDSRFTATITAVPEPSTLVLSSMLVLPVLLSRRRRSDTSTNSRSRPVKYR